MTHARFRPTPLRVLAFGLCAMGAAACQRDNIPTVVPQPAGTRYWALRNDILAATVAIGGHQQLTVTPVTKDGTPLTNLPAPTFTSSDTTQVTVSSTGVVTGIAETQGVAVVSSLTAQDVTYVDTTVVAVTPQTAVVKAVTINPSSSSTFLGLGDPAITLFASALDENGQPIPGVAISVVTLDPKKLTLFSYGGPTAAITAALGKARVVASTTSYGITKSDTVEFTIQYGMAGRVFAGAMTPTSPLTFSPSTILIGVGGTVSWFNTAGGTVSITFDNGLENIVGGNIPSIGVYQQETRQFTAAGTYTYKETGSGAKGTVIVRQQPTF